MRTFLINLDRSSERLATMSKRLQEMGLSFERVSGVDGEKLDIASVRINVPNARYPYHLTKGEIGCFLSHRKCWQKIAESKEDWGLVLEDDCNFYSAASEYLKSSDWIPRDCHLIHFYCPQTYATQFRTDRIIDLKNGNALFRERFPSEVGAYAYCMSKKAANLALEYSEVIQMPVDNFLFGAYSNFSEKIEAYRLQGIILEASQEIQSTIANREKKSPSRYKFSPWRLLKKIKIKKERKALQTVNHFFMK